MQKMFMNQEMDGRPGDLALRTGVRAGWGCGCQKGPTGDWGCKVNLSDENESYKEYVYEEANPDGAASNAVFWMDQNCNCSRI